LVYWTAVDTANADLKCWKVTQSAQTETASNVVLNSTDDQGFCGISIDSVTNYWYVFYFGNSDGTETYNTSMNLYYKKSTDSGANWSAQTLSSLYWSGVNWMCVIPIIYKNYGVCFISSSTHVIWYDSLFATPRTTYQLGI
jgi:hypothetical protein